MCATPANNLPAPISTFVGRRRETAEVRRRLETARLLTLTGPGGVGKTRLAMEATAASVKEFPGGVWLVDLTPVQDPSAVASAIVYALRLAEQGSLAGLEQLAGYLSRRRALLVLDNCEHLLDACAQVVVGLLSAAAELRVLATSRERLGVTGEHVLVVDPLPSDEAVELLRDRVTAVRPFFEITEADRPAVIRLCEDLDGLPLAIELAASRLRSFTFEQVADRLENRFALLTVGSRGASPHQRTLRATVEWSWDLCSTAEQLLWARLSVFAGDFTLDSVEGVCAGDGIDPDEVMDLLDRLIMRSVVLTCEGRSPLRYRLLATIRQYARERLVESGEEERLQLRHRDFILALAQHIDDCWFGPDQAEALERLRAEHPNLLAALDCDADNQARLALVTALSHHWHTGFLREGRRQLERALAAAPEPTPTRARALILGTWVPLMQGDLTVGDRWLDEADELVRELDRCAERDLLRAFLHGFRGISAQHQGRVGEATSHYEQAVAALTELGEEREAAGWLIALAQGQLISGDSRASDTGRKALAITEAYGERWARARLLLALGNNAWVRGEVEAAKSHIRTALECMRGFNDYVSVALMLEQLAWATASGGSYVRAGRLLGAADALCREVGTVLSSLNRRMSDYHERCEEQVVRAVGRASFTEALTEGARHVGPEQAIDFALEIDTPTATAPVTSPFPLTPREQEVAALVAKGMSNRQIASALERSTSTADRHVENILAKLGFSSRAQIAAWWVESRGRVSTAQE
ncbi:ATP-binding protein [Streptomyces sp. NBC_00576]|uniref:ATP-binding protein n=1 Tax=Streptomyces sp. NBC_00576 TaxID=2903665 RepID=UPI002E8172F3|nr:LuxR C-terminal-related transcriptional regulator [Streptomyces sp. NBC_00576]WUB69377.1 LuxR C-terminal-related transcriptional regulator [Streptomyces sp. NBC_00576]